MSDYFELVSSRESCRNYNPDRRPTREQLVKCIQTAQLAPSACNSQPWSYIVVNDPEKSPLVAAATQTAGLNKFTNNCPAFVIVCEEDAYLIGGKEPNQKYAHIDIGLSPASWAPSTRRCCWTAWASPSPNGCCWWLQSAMPPPTRCAPKSANRSTR